jgi:hypothetical protein
VKLRVRTCPKKPYYPAFSRYYPVNPSRKGKRSPIRAPFGYSSYPDPGFSHRRREIPGKPLPARSPYCASFPSHPRTSQSPFRNPASAGTVLYSPIGKTDILRRKMKGHIMPKKPYYPAFSRYYPVNSSKKGKRSPLRAPLGYALRSQSRHHPPTKEDHGEPPPC